MGIFMNRDEPYCLVLSGGGSKGVYHIGVWKALKEIGIEVDAFIGNSIGAVIAGFLAQGNEDQLYFIGDNIAVDYLLKIPEDLIENGELKVNLKHLSAFKQFYKDILIGGGLDTTPLKSMLVDSIDEEVIRKRGKDLGLVTFNISDMKVKEVFLEQIEEGTLIDYLMASSAFPGFNPAVIKGKKYIDGGVYDNIPYKLAKSRGYKKIIIVDVSGMGVNKKPNTEGTDTIYIKNSLNMGSVLDFNKKFLAQFIELGYLDTMKTFGLIKGLNYFIKPEKKREKHFISLLQYENTKIILFPFLKKKNLNLLSIDLSVRSILPQSMRYNKKDLFYNLIECAAVLFKLEKIHCYSVSEMILLIENKQQIENKKLHFLDEIKSKSEIKQLLKRIKGLLKETTPRDSINETAYYKNRLIVKIMGNKESYILHKSLRNIYPELKGGLFFLELLNKKLII